jgi:hypothetical protein
MKWSLFSFILIVHLCSCNQKYSNSKFGLSVTGKVGEIMLVCDKAIWDSDIKKHLDTNLTQFIMPFFPDVTTFELIHRSPQEFEIGNKRWRNLIFIELNPHLKEEAEITKEFDTWAVNQLVVRIKAKNYNSLLEVSKNSTKKVHNEFDEFEWKRILKQFEQENNEHINKKISSNFGIKLALPKGSKIVTSRKNFYRIEFPTETKPMEFDGGNGQTANFIQTGILIYQYDFSDSSQFELKNLLQDRDTMLKYNVLHEVKGVYMGTQYTDFIYPEGTFMWNKNKSIYGFEMRGMFKFTGKSAYSTGGGFWSFHFKNSKNKLICVSGYVDAPPTISWTNPLREIQAILKSVELVK